MPGALIVGSSDGIGLALAGALVDAGWQVVGLSRSPSPLDRPGYRHQLVDVREPDYGERVAAAWRELESGDACIYCAGVGEELDPSRFEREVEVFEVNLTGAVRTAAALVPAMVAAGSGHFVALSSQADRLIDSGAPSYAASKAGLSSYLEGLALALRPRGVYVTNVRFGFVATKMAQSQVRPFEISAERAARLVIRCLKKRPIRCTYPRRMAVLLWLLRWPRRVRVWWS